jgi:hypothetical protein
VGHRGTIGLHQEVVDEVDPEVDVLQACKQLGALGLREAGSVEVDRVEAVAAAGQLGAGVLREDLLPRVVAFERWQLRAADEPLRLVVEARARGRGREQLDERPRQPGGAACPQRELVGDVGVVAAEELVAALAGERNLHVLRRELSDEVGR